MPYRARLLPSAIVLHAAACLGSHDLPESEEPRFQGDSIPPGIREALAPLAERYPGIGFAVGRRGELQYVGGLGWADVAAGRPVQADTPFRIYSVIKPLTAAAAVGLEERGELDLDAPIASALPDLPSPVRGLTPRQLIGHLAAIRDYEEGEWMEVSRTHCESARAGIARFVDDPLVSTPGATYAYATFGYVLLSAVMEAAAGVTFDAVLHDLVLSPSGAEGIVPDGTEGTGMATPYEPAWFGRVKEARPVDNSCRFGAGGYVASAADLARFGMALMDGRIVPARRLDEVFASMTTDSGDSTGYAYGWGVGRDDVGRRFAFHSGSGIGGRSALYLLLDSRIAVAVVANQEGEGFAEEVRRIADVAAAGEP